MTRKEETIQAAIKEFSRFAERRVGFITGAEWADKTMIDKACKFLRKRVCDFDGNLFKDFRKVMEE